MTGFCPSLLSGQLVAIATSCCFGQTPQENSQTVAQGLPDPLVFASGLPVRNLSDWPTRRAELRELLLTHEYGKAPPPPAAVRAETIDSAELFEGAARMEHFALSWKEAPGFRMECGLILPTIPGPFPVIVAIDPVWQPHVHPIARQVIARGYAFAGLKYHDIDPDTGQQDAGIYPYYPECRFGSIVAWAWGASRLIDNLVERPEIDRARVVLTGHSRCGKAAILAGALDDRAAIVAPHCSGAGGGALYRIRNAKSETLGMITEPKRFHYWFLSGFRVYAGHEETLPFDQHFLHALIAPRAYLALEAVDDRWANPRGAWAACAAALPVYRLHSAADRLAFSVRAGGHDPVPADWETLMDFADTVFHRKPSQTSTVLRGEKLLRPPAEIPQ